jgi:hypothetical protein
VFAFPGHPCEGHALDLQYRGKLTVHRVDGRLFGELFDHSNTRSRKLCRRSKLFASEVYAIAFLHHGHWTFLCFLDS